MKCERCSGKDDCPYIFPEGLDEQYYNCPILDNRLFVKKMLAIENTCKYQDRENKNEKNNK